VIVYITVTGPATCDGQGRLGITYGPGFTATLSGPKEQPPSPSDGSPKNAGQNNETGDHQADGGKQKQDQEKKPGQEQGDKQKDQEKKPGQNQADTSKPPAAKSAATEQEAPATPKDSIVLAFSKGKADLIRVEMKVGKEVLPGEYPITFTATGCGISGDGRMTVSVGSPFVSAVIGVGTVVKGTQARSYKVINSDTLVNTSIGHKSPDFLFGALFTLNIRKRPNWLVGESRPWNAFISLRFSTTAENTINGFVFGGGYRITKYLNLVAGYSLSPNEEIALGFRTAAAQVVTANPNVPIYQRFNANAILNNEPGALDGFPLFVQSASGPTTQKVFSGDPTVVHYRGAGFFGITFPIELQNLFGGKKD
jgi:hypothetical protein